MLHAEFMQVVQGQVVDNRGFHVQAGVSIDRAGMLIAVPVGELLT